jgi:hypothetical protein
MLLTGVRLIDWLEATGRGVSGDVLRNCVGRSNRTTR